MWKNSLALALCVIVGVIIGIMVDRTVLLRLTEPESIVQAIAIPDTSYARFHDLHLFNVYGGDLSATTTEINFFIPIPESLAIEEKLELLARKLSYYKFRALPIEFVELVENGTDRIAVINLSEMRWNQDRQPGEMTGDTWSTGYFQGSSGGWYTALTLRETFLQREYSGEWINAVRFLYENEPIGPGDWDHFTLSGTQYSDQVRN